jgi:hypothetical protein
MSVFEIGQEHEEELADYLADSDQEHELGSVFEIGEDFIDPDTGEEVAEVGARFRRRRRGGRRRGMFRRGRARIPAFLARRMRRSGGKKLARLPGKPTVGDRWVALGLEDIAMDNTAGGAPVAFTVTQNVEPQMNVNPVRLLVQATDAAGADVSTSVRITSIKIGGSEQLTAGGAGIPAQMYKFNYQGPNPGVYQAASTGVKIFVTAAATVPAAANWTVKCGFVCKA